MKSKNKKLYVNLLFFFLLLETILYFKVGDPDAVILWQIRLPRYLLTVYSGMILASVGSIYQIMLNNPLAEPYILGVSSGAALGSTIAIVTGMVLFSPLFGFIGALGALMLVWMLAYSTKQNNSSRILLSGIVIGMFFSACLSLLMYLHQEDVGSILGILMGSPGHIFNQTEWYYFLVILFLSLVGLVYLQMQSSRIDLLATGDLSARSLGLNVSAFRKRIFWITSILVGVSVAYTGVIGFVGLLVPHIVRRLVGSNQRTVFPISALMGACFLLICDFIAKNITTTELPIGIVTSFIGCPFFLLSLFKRNR